MERVTARLFAGFLTAALSVGPATLAYEIPLTERSVREAYFLGQRHDEATEKFLASYSQHFPLPKKGPHVAAIELLTPYALAVKNSQRKAMGYSSQQAEKEYHDRGDTIEVRVLLQLTPTYPYMFAPPNPAKQKGMELRQDDFWKDFTIRLRQESATFSPIQMGGEPQYSASDDGSVLSGAEVWLEYDASEVESSATEVEVLTPDGQDVVAAFDLAKLR
jgi:hypothetical protein